MPKSNAQFFKEMTQPRKKATPPPRERKPRPVNAEKYQVRKPAIIQAIQSNERATITELSEALGFSLTAMCRYIKLLEQEGIIYRDHWKARGIHFTQPAPLDH